MTRKLMLKPDTESEYIDTSYIGWTLSACALQLPEVVTHYIQIPGSISGPLDVSDRLTLGEPEYSSRTFTATLERSDGTMTSRARALAMLMDSIHGHRCQIDMPEGIGAGPEYYVVGRATAQLLYHDASHTAVQLTAICEPWQYAFETTSQTLSITTSRRVYGVNPYASRILVPELTVSGPTGYTVRLEYPNGTATLPVGHHRCEDLYIMPRTGVELYATGSASRGTLTLTWRTGVL